MPFCLFDKLPPTRGRGSFFEGVGLDVGIGKGEDEYLMWKVGRHLLLST